MPAAKHDQYLSPQVGPTTEPDVRLPEIINLSGYRFVDLDNLPALKETLGVGLGRTGVLGTILLATEGINVAIAGSRDATEAARDYFESLPEFAGMWLKESVSRSLPFSKLKVRSRPEIIAFDGGELRVRDAQATAPAVDPQVLRAELDGENPPVLLDARNTYEIASGGFPAAVSLDIDNFRDFRDAVDTALDDGRLSLDDRLVTFCTGGIRCEKAAPWLAQRGFSDVRQIDGGILNWLETQGDAHWAGDCFVFDDRLSVDAALLPTGAGLCAECRRETTGRDSCACGSARPDRTNRSA